MSNNKAFLRRQEIWRHNGFRGSVAMTKSAMNAINSAATTTEESKRLAFRIYDLAQQLDESLKTRKDQQSGPEI